MQRDDGHRLDLVEVDSASYQIDHDDSGAVTEAFEFSMSYGPTGRLVQVDDTGGMLEAYAYDARGQLAAVFDGAGLRETFVYDGPQIIASYDAAEQPRWEAVWGAKLDELLAFHDFGSASTYLPLTDHRNSIVALRLWGHFRSRRLACPQRAWLRATSSTMLGHRLLGVALPAAPRPSPHSVR